MSAAAAAAAATAVGRIVPSVFLGSDLPCKRILHGLWQTSGGWGAIDPSKAVAAMEALADKGYTTFDLADHYGPAEDLVGALNDRLRARGLPLSTVQTFTKWVPRPGAVTRAAADDAIGRSLRRMKVDSLDLLQFHWWDYGMRAELLEAMRHLADMTREGKIRKLGLTNFDTAHVKLFVESGLPVVSNQVQFSVIDSRPARQMGPYCAAHGVQLLAYGTLLGGLLSEAWLGRPEPTKVDVITTSQRKYLNTIHAWGSWADFQGMLATLKRIADAHGVSIPVVGLRWVLDQSAVAGVIVGLRAGIAEHSAENERAFALELTDEDRAAIAAAQGKGRDLMAVIGDCGDEYR